MESEPKNDHYYVLRDQDTEGPLAKEVLFSMRTDGAISGETLVCRVGDSQWTPLDVLFPSAKQTAPPPPPPVTTVSVTTIGLPLPGEISKEDRQGLHDFLVTAMRSRKESEGEPFFKDALAKAFPALGILLGREAAVGKEDKRYEALFLLHKLLHLSATYLEAAPWVTYLAAKRHAHWINRFGIATAAFADFSNKNLVDEVARLANALEVKASALMDSETTANIQELIRFQDRKGRVAAAISILNQISGSMYRPLILKLLNREEVTVAENHLTVPARSNAGNIAFVCLSVGCLAIKIGCDFLKNPTNSIGPTFVILNLVVGFSLLLAGIAFATKAIREWMNEKKIRESNNADKHGIQATLKLVNGFAETFLAVVAPLLHELQIALSLDDLKGMRSKLEAYGTRGLEMERIYIKT